MIMLWRIVTKKVIKAEIQVMVIMKIVMIMTSEAIYTIKMFEQHQFLFLQLPLLQ